MVRRSISISAVLIALPLWLVTAPLWLPLTVLADIVGRLWRFPTIRLGLGLGVYLAHEWVGIFGAAWLWLTGRFGRRLDLDTHRALQGWWATSLLTWARRLFGVRMEPVDVEALPRSTFIMLSRHASMADAIVPAALVPKTMGRFVHYVMKRELLWVPAIDLIASRLDTHFVARAGDTDAEAEAIEGLAGRAQPDSVLVIFPEGTYSTASSRRRVAASLRRRGDDEAVAQAEKLEQLLPPRPAGTQALLRGRPDADVVILGHVGLEGVAEVRGLRRRLPLTEPVRLRCWTHARSELPESDEGRAHWLAARWAELDRWVAASRSQT